MSIWKNIKNETLDNIITNSYDNLNIKDMVGFQTIDKKYDNGMIFCLKAKEDNKPKNIFEEAQQSTIPHVQFNMDKKVVKMKRFKFFLRGEFNQKEIEQKISNILEQKIFKLINKKITTSVETDISELQSTLFGCSNNIAIKGRRGPGNNMFIPDKMKHNSLISKFFNNRFNIGYSKYIDNILMSYGGNSPYDNSIILSTNKKIEIEPIEEGYHIYPSFNIFIDKEEANKRYCFIKII